MTERSIEMSPLPIDSPEGSNQEQTPAEGPIEGNGSVPPNNDPTPVGAALS